LIQAIVPELIPSPQHLPALVKEEGLSQFILFGENSLRHVLNEYLAHYHAERPHQGKGNGMLFPSADAILRPQAPIDCRDGLGGLLKYYHRQAA
jgi:hypothetical protein